MLPSIWISCQNKRWFALIDSARIVSLVSIRFFAVRCWRKNNATWYRRQKSVAPLFRFRWQANGSDEWWWWMWNYEGTSAGDMLYYFRNSLVWKFVMWINLVDIILSTYLLVMHSNGVCSVCSKTMAKEWQSKDDMAFDKLWQQNCREILFCWSLCSTAVSIPMVKITIQNPTT